MTRPYSGYVIHNITLISIFFRLPFPPFPIEKYNNDSWENGSRGATRLIFSVFSSRLFLIVLFVLMSSCDIGICV
jgi:hypothetical protein